MSSEDSQYRLGVIYVGLSALAWSLSGLFMRAISTDLPTIIFLRGLVSGTATLLFFFYLERDRAWPILKAIRWPTILATLFSAGSMIFRPRLDLLHLCCGCDGDLCDSAIRHRRGRLPDNR